MRDTTDRLENGLCHTVATPLAPTRYPQPVQSRPTQPNRITLTCLSNLNNFARDDLRDGVLAVGKPEHTQRLLVSGGHYGDSVRLERRNL